MARQNGILPKGAFPHLRQPPAEADQHDPSTTQHHGVHGGYPQSYEPPRDIFNALRPDQAPGHGQAHGQPHAQQGQAQGLTQRLEAFAQPAAPRFEPPRQDAYGNAAYGDPAASAYPGHTAHGHAPHGHAAPAHPAEPHAAQPHMPQAFGSQPHAGYGQGYDAYGRPQPAPGGYATHGAYPADAAFDAHDPRHFGGQHVDPLHQDPRFAPAQGYAAPNDHFGRDGTYGYDDDPYRPDAVQAYGGAPALGHEGQEGEYYADEYADEAEPETRRGPRAIVVIGALVAAIGLGGGLAYGYKSLTSGGSSKLPILRADSAPAKAQPTEAGGKQIAHTDKKFLNRLTDERGSARPVPVSIQPPPERDSGPGDGATRRVPTMVVNRDGSISPTSGATSAPPPMTGVPGMVIEGLPPRMPPPQLREVQEPAAPARVAEDTRPAPPPVTPRRIASAPPTVAADPPPVAAPAPRVETERRRPAVRQAALPTPSATGSSGYVAVLSSRKSHMDALKSFADMQQKYSSVLQGRTPDVREVNLGEKGVWFRAVVGPPSSREAANNVCGQLKTAGYTGCWIMAY